jgi:alpha-glucosidase
MMIGGGPHRYGRRPAFQDSNGDGIGDLNGIIQRLDYLVKLGADAIWVAPIYRAPMADFGYDVADYYDVDPIFRTMQDFDRFLKEAHHRDLRLILDFVPDHSSDQHPWFMESRSSRENSKRDWYLWRDKPLNWMSNFGGSSWEWDKGSQISVRVRPVGWRCPDAASSQATLSTSGSRTASLM